MNILLLHPEMFFYKIRIYNVLSKELEARGHKLYIWCNKVQKGEKIDFRLIDAPFASANLNQILKEKKINVVINILFGISIMPFYLYALFLLKLKNIKHVYYGHGLDLKSTQKTWKVFLQNLIHLFFDKILLYRKEQIQFLWKIHHKKIFYANNTLLLEGYEQFVSKDKASIKEKFGISHKKIVLFSGRIQPRKRLDILIDFFVKSGNVPDEAGLVIVGDGLDENIRTLISKKENIYYLGGIYDKHLMQEIFFMSDIFCVPGLIGLGLVEAMYWGKPVLTIKGGHGPEIGYLKDGINGFVVKDSEELIEKLVHLLRNDNFLKMLSDDARLTYLKEATLEKMLQGFFEVLDSLHSEDNSISAKKAGCRS